MASSCSCNPRRSRRCRASTRKRLPSSRRSRGAGPTCPRTTAWSGGCRCSSLVGTCWRASCSRATSSACTPRRREAAARREQSTCCRRARRTAALDPLLPPAPPHPAFALARPPVHPPVHLPVHPPSIERRASPLAAAGGLCQPAPPRHRAGRRAARGDLDTLTPHRAPRCDPPRRVILGSPRVVSSSLMVSSPMCGRVPLAVWVEDPVTRCVCVAARARARSTSILTPSEVGLYLFCFEEKVGGVKEGVCRVSRAHMSAGRGRCAGARAARGARPRP